MKTKFYHVDAWKIADKLIKLLSPCCSRIEMAGSLRRMKPEVGDIELVAIPYPTFDLFHTETYEPHELDNVDWSQFGEVVKGGHKYKQITLTDGINLDLFIVTPPAQWGVQFLIRTGSAEFSHKMVTPRKYGGLMPSNYRVQDGAVWSNNHIIETPEEKDVFDLWGMKYIAPELRNESERK